MQRMKKNARRLIKEGPRPLISALIKELEIANERNPALEEETGACLIASGQTKPQCGLLTEKQCKAIGGVFIGGDCP